MTSKSITTIQSCLIAFLICFSIWQAYKIDKLNSTLSTNYNRLTASNEYMHSDDNAKLNKVKITIDNIQKRLNEQDELSEKRWRSIFINNMDMWGAHRSLSNTVDKFKYDMISINNDISRQSQTVNYTENDISQVQRSLSDKERRLQDIERFMRRFK